MPRLRSTQRPKIQRANNRSCFCRTAHALFFLLFFFVNLTYSRWTSSLPSCLWSIRIFTSLPGSRLTLFYRDASSALLQLVNQWLNFTYSRPRFPLRKKEHKSYFGKNRTHDFRTSTCAGYPLDHSGGECTTTPLCIIRYHYVSLGIVRYHQVP